MCGIVSIVGKNNCIPDIINCLKNLEYRGYDSSGIASIKNNIIEHQKSVGKISNLIKKINEKKNN